MNGLLVRDSYLPAIVHAVERQRYYEVLRQSPGALTELVLESLDRTLESSARLFEESQAHTASS